METEPSGDPDRESKPSTQHPHRTRHTHDTTDQWRDYLTVARANLGGLDCSPPVSRNYAPIQWRASGVFAVFYRVNVTQGGANLAQLTLTAQCYRQDALTEANVAQHGPSLAQFRVTLQ